jgi:hypothetical protein
MIEIRFDKTKDEVALLIWFLVDHSVFWLHICTCFNLNLEIFAETRPFSVIENIKVRCNDESLVF